MGRASQREEGRERSMRASSWCRPARSRNVGNARTLYPQSVAVNGSANGLHWRRKALPVFNG